MSEDRDETKAERDAAFNAQYEAYKDSLRAAENTAICMGDIARMVLEAAMLRKKSFVPSSNPIIGGSYLLSIHEAVQVATIDHPYLEVPIELMLNSWNDGLMWADDILGIEREPEQATISQEQA